MASNQIATVYVRNIDERVKPERAKEVLAAIFGEYGTVVDIIIKTNVKAKGQAFVVYESPESATTAAEETDGFEVFGKPIACALARARSDVTVAKSGNPEELETHKRRRIAEKDKKLALQAAEEQKRKRTGAVADPSRPAKAARASGLKSTAPGAGAAVVPDEYLPPNKILFVQNLPDDYDIEALTGLFGRFEGFREVRLVPGRKGIAFVEYEAESGAITAKENTAGMPVGEGGTMKVTYQRQ